MSKIIYSNKTIEEKGNTFIIKGFSMSFSSLQETKEFIDYADQYGVWQDIGDAHSCSKNAEYSSNGSRGEGYYCSQCGASTMKGGQYE